MCLGKSGLTAQGVAPVSGHVLFIREIPEIKGINQIGVDHMT